MTMKPDRLVKRTAIAMTVATAAVAAPLIETAHAARSFANCKAMNRVYAHGVGKPGARDRTSGTPVTNFKHNRSLYNANRSRDRDGDCDCEKR